MTKKTSTLTQRVRRKLSRIDSTIVMRKDFERLGGYEQVGRSIRELVKAHELVRMGYGIYAKTRRNKNGDRETVASIESLAKEALSRLNINVDGFTKYNDSELTVHLQDQITRRLSIDSIHIKYNVHEKGYDFSEMLFNSKRAQQEASRNLQLSGQKITEEINFFSSADTKNAVVNYSRGFKR